MVTPKMLKDVIMPASPNNRFNFIDGALSDEFMLDKPKIIFGYYHMSYKLDKSSGLLSTGMSFSEPIAESRQTINGMQEGLLSSGFAIKWDDLEKKGNKIIPRMYYTGTTNADVHVDLKPGQNFVFGTIAFPNVNYKTNSNSNAWKLAKMRITDRFIDIMGFNLSIKHEGTTMNYYLILYTLAIPLNKATSFHSKLKINGQEHLITTQSKGKLDGIGINVAQVVEAQPGMTITIQPAYKNVGETIDIPANFSYPPSPTNDKKYVQSLTAFQLPGSTEVKTFTLLPPATAQLNTLGNWRPFNIDMRLNNTKIKNILAIITYNLKVDKHPFSIRLKINGKISDNSVIGSSGSEYTSGTIYVAEKLIGGDNTLILEYLSTCPLTFTPKQGETTEHVSIQVLQFDK
jgi:hypothetical protein